MTREEAIRNINELKKDIKMHTLPHIAKIINETLDMAIKALEQQPKTGHWIETLEGTACSECGKYPYDDGEYHIANWSSDYCPNCGTEMSGGEENEDSN